MFNIHLLWHLLLHKLLLLDFHTKIKQSPSVISFLPSSTPKLEGFSFCKVHFAGLCKKLNYENKQTYSCESLPRDVACFSVYYYKNDNLRMSITQRKSLKGYQNRCVKGPEKFLVEGNPPQSWPWNKMIPQLWLLWWFSKLWKLKINILIKVRLWTRITFRYRKSMLPWQ